jgi:hypothetical protein
VAQITPAEWLVLGLRLVFVVLLYCAVAALFLALRRELRRTAPLSGRAGALPPPARLTLVGAAPADGQPGRTIPLLGDLIVGRRPPAEVLLRDDAVSGRHARFARRDGEWVVEDLGSTNGTFVNGQRLVDPAPLRPGDVVGIGNATWCFESDSPVGGGGPAPAGGGAP